MAQTKAAFCSGGMHHCCFRCGGQARKASVVPKTRAGPGGAALPKTRSTAKLFEEFPLLKKRYWGQHFWARGYFCEAGG